MTARLPRTDPSSSTHPSVLERAANGDADEFARVYAPLAYRMARRMGMCHDDAEDVMQQTLCDLLEKLPSFGYDPARGRFRGLVKTIVMRRCSDLLADRKKRQASELEDSDEDPLHIMEAIFEREWHKSLLDAAMDRVRGEVHPSTYRSFFQVVVEGREVPDVAKTLGLTKAQVYQNRHRVQDRLRQHLQELMNDGC